MGFTHIILLIFNLVKYLLLLLSFYFEETKALERLSNLTKLHRLWADILSYDN